MLANKSTLKLGDEILEGLMEIPEIGSEPEKVEVTCLADNVKKYENGVGDAGEMAFVFKYENTSATSSYRKLRKLQETDGTGEFVLTFADGTSFTFSAKVSVRLSGGGVNSHITFTCTMALQSDIVVKDPTQVLNADK